MKLFESSCINKRFWAYDTSLNSLKSDCTSKPKILSFQDLFLCVSLTIWSTKPTGLRSQTGEKPYHRSGGDGLLPVSAYTPQVQ